MTARILWTGSSSGDYPPEGVVAAFDLVQKMLGIYMPDQPVVIIHGKCPSGVDDMADAEAKNRGWETEPYPADWVRCSPLCEGMNGKCRRTRYGGDSSYCKMAGFWRNKQMVELHKVRPYRLCVAQPFRHWNASPGTHDCYKRAVAAGIETIALDEHGRFFVGNNAKAGRRK